MQGRPVGKGRKEAALMNSSLKTDLFSTELLSPLFMSRIGFSPMTAASQIWFATSKASQMAYMMLDTAFASPSR